MERSSLIFSAIIASSLSIPLASAERRDINRWENAPVNSRPCPFSCATEGIPLEHCRDWRNGDTCYVQDLGVPPSDAMGARGSYSWREREGAEYDSDAYRYDDTDQEGPEEKDLPRKNPSAGEQSEQTGEAVERALPR